MMIHSTLSALSLNITDGKHGDCENSPTSGYYFISCKDVRDGTIHYEDARQITERDFFDAHKRTLLEPNDILITNSGTIGRMAFVTDTPQTSKTTFQKSVAIVKPNPNKIIPKYLYYVLLNSIDSFITQANGSAQKNLLLSTMRSFNLFIDDDKQVQARIASILSAYDDLIENNQKQIKLLEEAAQRLYKEWFVDLRFPGWENTKIVDGVPEGWTCTKLGKVLKTFSGSTPSRQNNEYYQDGSIPWLKTKELNDRFILSTEEKITETALKSTSVHIIEKESVIMAMYGATIGKLGISTSALTCNQACCVFDLTVSPLTNEFLFSWLYHKKPYLISLGKGAAQPNLSQEFIQSIDIILPPSIFIAEYTRLTHPFFQSIKNNQEKIEHLSILRNQLLKNLLH